MDKKPKVTVIIPTYGRNKVLIDTINSVLNQKTRGFEILVIDQSKTHDKRTRDFLNEMSIKKIRYYNVFPPSLPAARNFGLKKARGEIVIYIDDDVLLDQGFIKAHLDSYKKRSVVCVAGRVKQKDKPVTDTLLYFRKTGFGAGSLNYPKFGFAETALGCNMSFRKKAILKIGGFDTNFIGNAIGEESDLCFRLKKRGYKILFNPKASLFHRVYKSGGCREEKSIYDNYIVYRNEVIFFLRHMPIYFLPHFFGGHFFKYVLNRQLIGEGKIISRSKVFTKGFLTGALIYFFPKDLIISKEIS